MNAEQYYTELAAVLPAGVWHLQAGNLDTAPAVGRRLAIAYRKIPRLSTGLDTAWLVCDNGGIYYVQYQGVQTPPVLTPQAAIAYWELTRGQT